MLECWRDLGLCCKVFNNRCQTYRDVQGGRETKVRNGDQKEEGIKWAASMIRADRLLEEELLASNRTLLTEKENVWIVCCRLICRRNFDALTLNNGKLAGVYYFECTRHTHGTVPDGMVLTRE